MQTFVLIVFHSTHSAIRSEVVLEELKPIMMPTLRQISASCGISLKIRDEQLERAKALLIEADVEGYKIFRVEEDDNKNYSCQLIKK